MDKSIDPRGVETDYSYTDSRNSYSLPTTIYSYPALNSSQDVGGTPSVAAFASSAVYNYDIGKATNTTDVNSNTTYYTYNDLLARLTELTRPDSGTTNIVYTDTASAVSVLVEQDQNTAGDTAMKTITSYDGLGRKVAAQKYEGLSGGLASNIYVAQTYDNRGRTSSVSNPYRTSPGDYTQYTYDGIGRVKTTTLPDGSVNKSLYYGSYTLATDPAGNNRQSQTDALGRLTQVIENQTTWASQPSGRSGQASYTTAYGYDPLDDLTTVTASQNRSFSYDSLKRLSSATNPESGTITYTYDNSGNVVTRSSLRSITASMTYDGLNRILTKQFSDSGAANPTPWVSYLYDTMPNGLPMPNGLGRLTQVQSAAATESWGTVPQVTRNYGPFDTMGRVTGSSETIGSGSTGSTYNYTYGYNVAGEMISEGYPSGRTVSMGYDPAGRPASVAGTLNSNTTNYATLSTDPTQAYTQYGTIYQLPFLNGVTETSTYNSRMQLTGLKAATNTGALLTLGFSYDASGANNGNMLGETIVTSGGVNATQTFLYDAYNRLCGGGEGVSWTQGTACSGASASGVPWWQVFSYDQAGNRAVTAGTMENPDWTPQDLTHFPSNRWVRGAGDGYDKEGNQTSVASNASPGTASSTFTFDAENRMVTADVMNMGAVQYAYDGEGHRVEKLFGGALNTLYSYDAAGELTSEFGGAPTSGTEYLTADHLGSTRLVTDTNGNVLRRYDYMPFGEEIATGVGGRGSEYPKTVVYPALPDGVTDRKFTGKERDSETGLDYFGARYFSGAMGRFTSPDEVFADQHPEDPQSWNLYSYTRNNPLARIDTDGHFVATITGAVTGGLIGGAVSAWRGGSFWKGAASGAVSGAIAGSIIDTGGASLGVLAAAGAAGGVGGGIVQRALNGQSTTVGDVAVDATVGAATGVVGGKVGEAVANVVAGKIIQNAANDAIEALGPGSGGAYGTRVHSAVEGALNDSTAARAMNLNTEVSYSGGQVVQRNTPGSVRVDVVRGNPNNPGAAFDLKTGAAKLTPARTQKIQQNLPRPVPVKEIKPNQP